MFHRGAETLIFRTEPGYMRAMIVHQKGKNLLQPGEGRRDGRFLNPEKAFRGPFREKVYF